MIREFEERDAEGVAALMRDLPWFVTAKASSTGFGRGRSARTRACGLRKRKARSWAACGPSSSGRRNVTTWPRSGGSSGQIGAARETGSRLYELAAAHGIEHGARELGSGGYEEDGHRFLERRGYERTRQARFSALDPRSVDTSALTLPEGFRLVTLADLPGRERDLYELDMEAAVDVPADDAVTNLGFDEWLEWVLRDPLVSRDGSFVVVDGDRPVAFTRIKVAGRHAENDMTGTARDYRRRGLAQAAKLASIRWCAQHGIERLATGNDSTNVGMLAINNALGYQPWIIWQDFVLRR
jgi:RimJ/RimL family protein N-acetyltransferase